MAKFKQLPHGKTEWTFNGTLVRLCLLQQLVLLLSPLPLLLLLPGSCGRTALQQALYLDC